MSIYLHPFSFRRLLEKITNKSNELIMDENPNATKFSLESIDNDKGGFFGTKTQGNEHQKRNTIPYFINLGLAKKYNDENWGRKKYALRGFNSRILQTCYKDYQVALKNLKNDKEAQLIKIPKKYWDIFLDFIGIETINFIEELKPLEREVFVKKNSSVFPDGKELELGNNQSEKIIYNCYYLESKRKTVIQGFLAEFTFQDDIPSKVEIINTPSKEDYFGEVKILGDHSDLHIIAQTKGDSKKARPLSIVISQTSRKIFQDLKILVGNFINIGEQSNGIHGPILLEKISVNDNDVLSNSLIEAFLYHSKAQISQGGFLKTDDFEKHVSKICPDWKSEKALFEKMEGKCYEVFILSKKGKQDSSNEQLNRIEKALFRFGEKGSLICKSIFPTSPRTYNGHLEYHSEFKAILFLHREINQSATYQIVLDLHDDHLEEINSVYSGITQDGTLAAGRAKFFEITQEVFDKSKPELFDMFDNEAQNLLKEYTNLEDFFSGNSDNFLDNTNVFYEDTSFTFSDGNFILDKLPGIYYYYRTRTIRGHYRKIKRYPFLIKEDGNFLVKVKANGDNYTATGRAFRKNDRVYMHLLKKDKYDGLAILYPNWKKLGEENEIIQAVYASTSKKDHLMAGRLFFKRVSSGTSEDVFNAMDPIDIDIDNEKHYDIIENEVEQKIVSSLIGQINNYVAVRHPNQESHFLPGEDLFYAACYHGRLGTQEGDSKALELLETSILSGGFRNIELIRKEFETEGSFFNIKNAFRSLPKKYSPTTYQEDDIIEYLESLLLELFPESSITQSPYS